MIIEGAYVLVIKRCCGSTLERVNTTRSFRIYRKRILHDCSVIFKGSFPSSVLEFGTSVFKVSLRDLFISFDSFVFCLFVSLQSLVLIPIFLFSRVIFFLSFFSIYRIFYLSSSLFFLGRVSVTFCSNWPHFLQARFSKALRKFQEIQWFWTLYDNIRRNSPNAGKI